MPSDLITRAYSLPGSTRVIIHIGGELDVATAPQLAIEAASIIADHQPSLIIADLSELGFCDSTGLSALLALRRCIGDQGGSLVLAGAHGVCRRVLMTTGVDRHLHCYPTLEEAEQGTLDQAPPPMG